MTRGHLARRWMFLLALATVHCSRPTDQHESSLKWGLLESTHVINTGLLSLPPNSKICVRGYMAKEAVAAIRQRTDAIGRTPWLPAAVDCADGIRTIEIRGPSHAICSSGVAGYTNAIDNITVCQNFPANFLTHVFLHETGHMWGLCDQYGGGTGCEYGRVNPNTIMGVAGSGLTRLTPDDIEGLKFVTSQPTLGANSAWQSFRSVARSGGAMGTSNAGSPTPQNALVTPTNQGSLVLQNGGGR